MARLTKLNRQKILDQNEGFTANTSYDSRNSSYDRQYTVKGGKLHIQESCILPDALQSHSDPQVIFQ